MVTCGGQEIELHSGTCVCICLHFYTTSQPSTKFEHSPVWKSKNLALHKLCNTVKSIIFQFVVPCIWQIHASILEECATSVFRVCCEDAWLFLLYLQYFLTIKKTLMSTKVHGVAPKKSIILIVIAVRIWDVTASVFLVCHHHVYVTFGWFIMWYGSIPTQD
jgi:hypothetical protein